MSATSTTAAPIESKASRLRRLVVAFAGEATLTCTFVPGGRLNGAGIVSQRHCATCNQARHWHEIAESIPLVELAESFVAAGRVPEEGES
jgi:hypothetical protein